ncbi:hypothetical protein [Salininema proteolyticum]|uniref:Holliday junction resolvase n=1 Tax=Salininema proteolyticum TaxID=1607685 RepID=A0ABV8U006_9ACTN
MAKKTTDATTARNNRNKRNGQRWQTALRDGLRGAGLDVERLVQTGTDDEGDLVIRLDDGRFIVIEAKAGVMHAADFVDQTRREASNFARHRALPHSAVDGIAVVKRRQKAWEEAYVLTTLRDYLGLGAAE